MKPGEDKVIHLYANEAYEAQTDSEQVKPLEESSNEDSSHVRRVRFEIDESKADETEPESQHKSSLSFLEKFGLFIVESRRKASNFAAHVSLKFQIYA
jgi:hypothetical protein